MTKVLIINGHEPYSFSEGKLNAALTERAKDWFEAAGAETRVTNVAAGYDVETEIENHVWADLIFIQFPVNWMGLPWSLKKYQDLVLTAGMDGRICVSDGRSSSAPTENYGTGGALHGRRYALSLTFNAPREAFDRPDEYLFQGRSVDDLMWPVHMTYRFTGMEALETFAVYDVMKNPTIAEDFLRLDAHLDRALAQLKEDVGHVAA
ncbi:MAG: NAD(P)H-dependent oxidoreductase [Pseudomonadota bacterium]